MFVGTNISLVRGGRSGAFTPASLFADGEDGALLEAPTLDTLYTDDAGTTRATTGDPVAVWSDGSGNGNDATQTELANRMVVSGSGPYYLDPDGVNDNFSIPLGAGFTGDFCLILDTGPIFGSIDTGTDTTWNYTVNPAYIPDGKIHALIVVDRAFTETEKQGLVDYYADAVSSGGSVNLANSFRDRDDITALYLPEVQVSNVVSMARDASNLQHIDLSLVDASGSNGDYRSVFRDCKSVATINVGDGRFFTADPDRSYGGFAANTNLNQASIDAVLVAIETAGFSNASFSQSGGSAPSATGEAAIDALRARGWTVSVTGGY